MPLRSSAVPEATTDIRHLVQHIVARAPNAHGHARYLCRIFGNADEALKTTGGWVYFKSLGESDIEPAKLKRFLDKEAKMTKESRHQRALKTDIPLMSEVELNAAKKAKPRSKKRITNTTSAAGVGSPFDLKRVQGDFKKREPALLDIIGGNSTHLSAKGVGGRRDDLREFAKTSGVSSAIYQGWVEMEEALSVQKLSDRQKILTHQCLHTACGFVEYGSLEHGPSQYFYNSTGPPPPPPPISYLSFLSFSFVSVRCFRFFRLFWVSFVFINFFHHQQVNTSPTPPRPFPSTFLLSFISLMFTRVYPFAWLLLFCTFR